MYPSAPAGTINDSCRRQPDGRSGQHVHNHSSITGTIGNFSIDAAGNWTFTANSAFDSLNVGDSVNETFNVTSVDGTPSTVQITINGTNDAATRLERQSNPRGDRCTGIDLRYADRDRSG